MTDEDVIEIKMAARRRLDKLPSAFDSNNSTSLSEVIAGAIAAAIAEYDSRNRS